MIDLSANKHIKQLCMRSCSTIHHTINMRRIDDEIRATYITNNRPINWKNIQAICFNLVGMYIHDYTRINYLPLSTFGDKEKLVMTSNIVDHFKKKYGAKG
jgi:hypothetical protein